MNPAYAIPLVAAIATYLVLRSRDSAAAFAPADDVADNLRAAEYAAVAAVSRSALTLSPAGLDAIKRHEGLRLEPYDDGAGFLTIGYGHRIRSDEIFDRITLARAQELLQDDVRAAENAVNALVSVPLEQNQFDALVSLVFNIGAGAFRRSTLLRLLNNNDRDAAAAQFDRWTRAGGRVLAGLVSRRAAERAMFEA
jgi:lysozyme